MPNIRTWLSTLYTTPQLMAHFKSMTGLSPHDAEDALQNAALRAWKYRLTYDPKSGDPLPWFSVIMWREAGKIRKQNALSRKRYVGVEIDEKVDVPCCAYENAAMKELADVADDMFSPVLAEAVKSYLLEGWTAKELEEVTGVTRWNIYKAVDATRKRFLYG